MKSYQFAERTIHCGHAGQWDQLIGACAADQAGTVIDLRTFLEIGDQSVPKAPEGWGYRRLPVTGATVSEQDLDVFRREFYRKPQTVVIGPNATRAQLVVTASVARLERGGWDGAQRAEGEDKYGEYQLLEWLTAYLVRHGYESNATLEAVQAQRPASSARASEAKYETTKPVNTTQSAAAKEAKAESLLAASSGPSAEETREVIEPSGELQTSAEPSTELSETSSEDAAVKKTRQPSKSSKEQTSKAKGGAKKKK